MSWTAFIGIAVYCAAEAWKAYKEEERIRNQQLTHQPQKQLSNDPFAIDSGMEVMDCFEQIRPEEYDDRY